MRAAATLGLLIGCGKPAPVEPVLPPDPAPPVEVEVEVEAMPCDALAQIYCEDLPPSCAQMRDVVAATGMSPRRCAELRADLIALGSPDLRRAAAAESFDLLVRESGLPREKVDDLAGDGEMDVGDNACPHATTPKGTAGQRTWCESDDGLPHGPVVAWNGRGELVQEGRYERGRLVDPGLLLPPSRDVPFGLFACPDGTDRVVQADRGDRMQWCELPDGRRHGPSLRWRDGLVVGFTLFEEDRPIRIFEMP